jgi:hypothetical protein
MVDQTLAKTEDENVANEVPTYIIKLVKEVARSLQPAKMKEQAEYIAQRILDGGRHKVWDVSWSEDKSDFQQSTRMYTYRMTLTLTPKAFVEGRTETQFQTVKDYIEKAAGTQRWKLAQYGDETFVAEKEPLDLYIPDDWYAAYFSHIYEREPQIRIVKSAIQAAIDSNYENRFHCVLFGPAACGKTEITRTFISMFGNEAVLEYDGTATTQAGALKDLKERENTPRLLVVEEIEKTGEDSLRWLLGLLDHRGEIRKTNARESFQREIKLLCIATVNDFDLFSKMMYGALASRFAHKVYCPRPNEAILTRIITREIGRLPNADDPEFMAHAVQWIQPAIKFALDHKMNDPRQVTAICLSGQDALIDGSYQKMLDECMAPEDIEDVMKGKGKTEAEVARKELEILTAGIPKKPKGSAFKVLA